MYIPVDRLDAAENSLANSHAVDLGLLPNSCFPPSLDGDSSRENSDSVSVVADRGGIGGNWLMGCDPDSLGSEKLKR